MQWVMAGTAAARRRHRPAVADRPAGRVQPAGVYHFAGIISAITSPQPTPWLTGQLWARVFRPHLEFSYVNNAYQFYSPQPGPAEILWFCITGTDGESRWYQDADEGRDARPAGHRVFPPPVADGAGQPDVRLRAERRGAYLARRSLVQDFPYYPTEMMPERQQYRARANTAGKSSAAMPNTSPTCSGQVAKAPTARRSPCTTSRST